MAAEITPELNAAYGAGDIDKITAVARDFEWAEMPDNPGKRLVILIRREDDLKKRIAQMKTRAEDVRRNDIAQMAQAHEEAAAMSEDIFAEVEEERISEISEGAALLARLARPLLFLKHVNEAHAAFNNGAQNSNGQ